MRPRKWGRIINIASVAGRQGSRLNSAYAASKAGVIALAQTWALDLGPDGITVNAVLPGFIFTTRTLSAMSKKAGGADIDRARSEENTSELKSLMRTSYAVFCLNTKKNITKHEDYT